MSDKSDKEKKPLNYRPEQPVDETWVPRAGDRVFFYLNGDPGAKPSPATVLEDTDPQRALNLCVHYPGNVSYYYAVKHMSLDATVRDRERNGGWTWAREWKSATKTQKK